MFQNFFEDTIMSRFIKNLLATTPIPLYTCVEDGDILIKGGIYVYKDYIIKCEKMGRLIVSADEALYPSDTLFPSAVLYPGTGEPPAQFRVLAYYSFDDIRYNYTYHSRFSYYDSDTHKHLGEYIRYIKALKGVDMTPFYNCYTYKTLDNVTVNYLNDDGRTYSFEKDDRYKIVAIPIKFFKKYTIAIDCETEVLCRCVIYGDSGMVIDRESSNKYLSDYLEHSFLSKPQLQFDNPFVYSVSLLETDNEQLNHKNTLLLQQQKNLHLLIRLPKDNESSIVVLEGDYTQYESPPVYHTINNKYQRNEDGSLAVDGDGNIILLEEGIISKTNDDIFFHDISLLQFNCLTSFAFSDRLIEYLTLNIINEADELFFNVARVQQALMTIDERHKTLTGEYRFIHTDKNGNEVSYSEAMHSRGGSLGIWDDLLTDTVKQFINSCRDTYSLRDMDCRVNKDLEKLLVLEGGRY